MPMAHPTPVTQPQNTTPIAVVGMGCWYPGAADPRALWENILARRQQFRRMPDQRLPLRDYYDADPSAPDKTYSRSAALIDGFVFDWRKRRIPQSTVESTDIVHWLALEVALQTMQDAGYEAASLPRDRTAVMLGNSLTGEQFRAMSMRPRWPFVARCLRGAAASKGLSVAATASLVEAAEVYFKSVFPPMNEDSLAGSLSNTIAGRVCNFLDLHGGGYVVDGACSSSLLAVITAANALCQGDVDLAFAGGVDVSLDTFELIGFAKAGALSASDARIYDRAAKGFLPGEGCGFVLLKRWSDAVAAGDRIYALLRGWGISSDGKGGITAPSSDGQALALRRAYERAGYSPHSLSFIEGHGTGTRLGDKIELEGIAKAMLAFGAAPARHCGVTSFKSLVGHTKAAAGIGGFIKAVMAVNRRVIPPTAGCVDRRETFEDAARSLYPVQLGEVRPAEEVVRAGVSAMGFGGINSHVTLESADPPASRLDSSLDERAIIASQQRTELLLLTGDSLELLRRRTGELLQMADGMSVGELADLSAALLQDVDPQAPLRLAMVVEHPDGLSEVLQEVAGQLASGAPKLGQTTRLPRAGAWWGQPVGSPRLGFVFPGQGSQALQMARTLVERFEWARELVQQADAWLAEVGAGPVSPLMFRAIDRSIDDAELQRWQSELTRTEVAQPAICLASLLWLRRLNDLGVHPQVVAGHSLGELTAFHAAAAFDARTLMQLAALRGRAMSEVTQPGAMVSLRCDEATAAALIERTAGYLTIANRNSLRQIVVSGDSQAVAALAAEAQRQEIQAKILPVSSAFHSTIVAEAAEVLRGAAVVPQRLQTLTAEVLSGVPGVRVDSTIELREHFARQVCASVDFVGVAQRLAERCDLAIEVGPGRVLCGLLQDGAPPALPQALPVEATAGNDRDFNDILATLFVRGAALKLQALHQRRLIRPFVPAAQRVFIENPCERSFEGRVPSEWTAMVDELGSSPLTLAAVRQADVGRQDSGSSPAVAIPKTPGRATTETDGDAAAGRSLVGKIEQTLLELVEAQTGFPLDSLSSELRLLDDLNLDSIKAADFVAKGAKRWNVAGRIDPANFANATLAQIAAALATHVEALPAAAARLEAANGAAADAVVAAPVSVLPQANYPSWVRNFGIDWQVAALASPEQPKDHWRGQRVRILSPSIDAAPAVELEQALQRQGAVVRRGALQASATVADNLAAKPELLVLLLPPTAASAATAPAGAALRQLVENVCTSVRAIPARGAQEGEARVAFVVWRDDDAKESLAWSIDSLVASVHLERPDLRLRALTMHASTSAERLAACLAAEFAVDQSFAAVRYSDAAERSVPVVRVQSPRAYALRQLQLRPDEVLLVTGGAKGITAECALRLADATRLKTVLVGSSAATLEKPGRPADNEIVKTLQRYRDAGLHCEYRRCDMTDATQVRRLVEDVRNSVGSIAAVVHGAGLNRPRRAETVSAPEALEEIAAKLGGALHLFEALEDAPPQLFVVLTSIIGVTGMPGNAWYAFANECLDLSLGRFAARHPHTQAASVAFSVWDEVGMGARLGSVTQLAKAGIAAISVDEGTRRFVDLALHDPGCRQVVVSARMGNLDTWKSPASPLPQARRFLDDIRSLQPGVEIICRTHLTLERDPYLNDHVFKGSHLFPTVFGLEAMAQAVATVLGLEALPLPLTIEDIDLSRPLVVNPESGLVIETRAVMEEQSDLNSGTLVRVSIRSEQTGFTPNHFSAVFRLAVQAPFIAPRLVAPKSPISLDPQQHLYGSILFQGPRFHRIDEVVELDDSQCSFFTKMVPSEEWILGDPYFRDSLLQSFQPSVTPKFALPIRVDRWRIHQYSPKSETRCFGRMKIIETTDDRILIQVIAEDQGGQTVELLSNYSVRVLEEREFYPTASNLVSSSSLHRDVIERQLKPELTKLGLELPTMQFQVIAGISNLNRDERHRRELPLLIQTLHCAQRIKSGQSSRDLDIDWLSDGKPVVSSDPLWHLSLSHDEDLCLSVAAPSKIGCDIAPLPGYTTERWRDILGTTVAPLLETAMESGVSEDLAGTLLWAAAETLRKATNQSIIDLTIDSRDERRILFNSDELPAGQKIVSILVSIPGQCDKVISSVVFAASTSPQPSDRRSFDGAWNGGDFYKDVVELGPQGQTAFVHRFPLCARDSANLGRTVYFAKYAEWAGKVRELSGINTSTFHDRFYEMLGSDEITAVTNTFRTDIFAHPGQSDIMEGQFWLEEVEDEGVDAVWHWWAHPYSRNVPPQLVANSRMKIAVVRTSKRGEVSSDKWPTFAKQYLDTMAPKFPRIEGSSSEDYSHRDADLGGILYERRIGPRGGPLLKRHVMHTTLADSNLVGNLYFACYPAWQGWLRDQFFYEIDPSIYHRRDGSGELLCRSFEMAYLRNAMPFDSVEVTMRIDRLFDCGLQLAFEYFRVESGGSRTKIAYGHQQAMWGKRVAERSYAPALWPPHVREALQRYTDVRESGVFPSHASDDRQTSAQETDDRAPPLAKVDKTISSA